MAINTAPRREDNLGAVVPTPKWQPVWGVKRISILLTLAVFLLYGTFRAAESKYYSTEHYAADHSIAVGSTNPAYTQWQETEPHYLSPFYSPPLQDWGVKLPFGLSVAFILLIFPGAFRGSCYFCRRTYYRNVFGTPPACAAREVLRRSTKYNGEREFPWWLNNFHRYTLYIIFIYVIFHWIHLIQALNFGGHFGIGIGTIILGTDAVFLTLYVVSCHSFRHLVGGIVNKFSSAPGRFALWQKVTALNENHGFYFWASLISVGLADVYVRFVCSGMLTDYHFVLGGK